MAPTSRYGTRGLLVLSCVCVSQAVGSALDEVALIQRDTHLQPDADTASPAKDIKRPATVITLSQTRRKNAITLMREQVDKYMEGQTMGQRGVADGPDSLNNALDPAQIMEMLPALMDALRDDNFIRSFIQFEDGVEKASKRVTRATHLHLEQFLRASNETMALQRADTSSALRLSFARFLDHWVHQVLTSYTEELTEYAEVFKDQVGGDHQLSKGFADIFVPLFKNVTEKLSKKMIAGTGNSSSATSFEEAFSNDTAHFCDIAAEIVHNATKSSSEAVHVLKMLNATRRSAVPMLGKYLQESLPVDATEEDKKVPERMMLVTDYEVTAIYAGLNALRETMGEYAGGLAPLLREHMQCETGAASRLYGPPRLAALLAVTLSARFAF